MDNRPPDLDLFIQDLSERPTPIRQLLAEIGEIEFGILAECFADLARRQNPAMAAVGRELQALCQEAMILRQHAANQEAAELERIAKLD